jgi:hypothetical protein
MPPLYELRRNDKRVGVATSAALLSGACKADKPSVSVEKTVLPIHYDQDGLIVHKKGPSGPLDGGDTAQREGWYWFGVWIRQQMWIQDKIPNYKVTRTKTFPDVLRLLKPRQDGVFYRHPKLPPWNNPYDKEYGFSRDQMLPLMAAMGVWSLSDPTLAEPLRRLWNALPQDTLGGTKHTFNGPWWPSNQAHLVYTGDIVGPATINFYRRALGQDPMTAGDGNGPNGERELAANVVLRLVAATDKNDTGDDLNLIVMLLLTILQHPNKTPLAIPPLPILPTLPTLPQLPIPPPEWRQKPLPSSASLTRWLPPTITTDALVSVYKARPVSYGSYLGAYRQKYGVDINAPIEDVVKNMEQGIRAGWKPDALAVYGAVRWYHREESGANPELAELYAPIIHKYFE